MMSRTITLLIIQAGSTLKIKYPVNYTMSRKIMITYMVMEMI